MTTMRVLVDTNVLVALVDARDKCRSHEGRLNFNDALIGLVTRELSIRTILSFDKDFDEISWLERLSDSSKITRP